MDIPELKQVVAKHDESSWKQLYLQHARREREDVFPFPGDDIQEITNSLKGEKTAQGAISILDCILACINDVTVPSRNMQILDYGCGWGRMTRLLPFYFAAEGITGVDVDERLITSANELVPAIKHVKVNSVAELPIANESFDIVFANSVFSHLSEMACTFTLRELSRVLRVGGVLVISVLEQPEMEKFYIHEGQRDWITRILGEQEQATAKLKQNGFVWGSTERWPEYGIAIMGDAWLGDLFERLGLSYRVTKRGEHSGTHNYKVGVKQ